MQIVIETTGHARCVYDEAIDLTRLGEVEVSRASQVEPDHQGRWWADLSPVGGPTLGPFALRSMALEAETGWLESHWLNAVTPESERRSG